MELQWKSEPVMNDNYAYLLRRISSLTHLEVVVTLGSVAI